MRIDARQAARRATPAWLIVAVLGLSGCERKVQLQWVPDARRASEIAALLAGQGIIVERKLEKSGVMLSVVDSDLPRSIGALREAGFLRAVRPSADEALGKRGIVPTPSEERARQIHAIERELEATLMEIDGIVAARVSVVLSERPAPGAPLAPASASVLVKHRADIDLSPLVPGIASLVKNGVPGLAAQDDRHVSVMLLPEQRIAPAAIGPTTTGSVHRALWLTWFACAGAAIGYFADRVVRRLRLRSPKPNADNSASAG